MKRLTLLILISFAIVQSLLSNAAECIPDIWLEAEAFKDKGGWVVDQQYMDNMGSPYIMAHGLGNPVEDASTTVDVPKKGKYNIFVRTYNWTSPWNENEGPGKFNILVNGKKIGKTLGSTGSKWEWQYAGSVNLNKGETIVSLHDLTGFNGRCDAIVLTTESNPNLPDGGDALKKLRRQSLGINSSTIENQEYDFAVIGGGIAGMCAAVTAARNGLKTVLVNDRPVLGGNNSAEVRVHLGGHIELGPNKGLGRMIREFGHSRKGNAKPAEFYEDDKKEEWIKNEANLTYMPNFHATDVNINGNTIESVVIENIETGKEISLHAPLFADCTGDGTIGYLAGADFRMGREGRDEFFESLAPVEPDSITMGVSVQWYSDKAKNGKPKKFPVFNYGITFDDSTCEPVKKGEWKWETGMNLNQITDAEKIRDYGLAVVFSNWSYLKNKMKTPEEIKDRDLAWVGYIGGKRESRRLLGDYILKQDDIDKNVSHEDASFTTSWSIDLHFPDSLNSVNFPGKEYKAATIHRCIYPYAVPYRCLYSRNIDNLFMAGRNISTTHVGMGTTRVMRTTGMMGEVVGMAASIAKKNDTTPRGVYQRYLPLLRSMMKEGAGKDASTLPDNQHFNESKKLLTVPRAFLPKDADELGNVPE